MTIKVCRNRVQLHTLRRGLVFFLLILSMLCGTPQDQSLAQSAPAGEGSSSAERSTPPGLRPEEKAFLSSLDERIKRIEDLLQGISRIGKLAESRSLDNKIMAKEQKRLAIGILIALIVIAMIFPLTIWLLSRKRLLGLSGLSDEVAATILVVEERQAKLAGILEEMQAEFDEEYNRTSPDLKDLMEQAKKFLDENKRDLERVGSGRATSGETTS